MYLTWNHLWLSVGICSVKPMSCSMSVAWHHLH
jgi:hypothetical protein